MSLDSNCEKKIIDQANWFSNRRLANATKGSIFSEFAPESLEDAYKVQKKVTKTLNWHVGGWKLGGTNQVTRDMFSCHNAYYGPLDNSKIIYSENQNSFEWMLPATLRGEAEISFRLSSKVNMLRRLNSLDEVFGYVDAIAPSLECPYCSIPSVQSSGLATLIADLCGSGYLILGKVVPIDPVVLMRNQIIEISQLGNYTEIGNTGSIIGLPVQALFEFLNLAFEHKLDIRAGQWIATGGCTSCVELLFNSIINIKFQNMESFQIVSTCSIGN